MRCASQSFYCYRCVLQRSLEDGGKDPEEMVANNVDEVIEGNAVDEEINNGIVSSTDHEEIVNSQQEVDNVNQRYNL